MSTTSRFDLARARVNAGLSVRRLAAACGVSRNTIDLLEKGRAVRPASAKLVADYFGVEVTDLMPPEGVTSP